MDAAAWLRMKVYSPQVFEALPDCLRTVYWYQADLKSFLIRCGVERAHVARLPWEYKRTAMRALVDELASQPASAELLESGHDDDAVLENALRVLLLYGDKRTLAFCDLYKGRKSRLGSFAVLLPALLPQQADRNRYEGQLLDLTRDMNDRMGDLAVLSAMTDDLGGTLETLEATDPDHAQIWRFALLMQSALHPFDEAVPLLEEVLKSTDAEQAEVFAFCLAKLGELPGERVTDMVVRFLSHSSPRIRLVACLTLQARRCRGARVPLLHMLDREDDAAVIQSALLAVLASGPVDVDGGRAFWSRSPHTTLWRSVLAGRLRAAEEAGSLVAVAIGPANNWQLRRAAILAASRLPFGAAFARIADAVMQERSPFTLDTNHSLQGHQALCDVLELELDEEQLHLLQTYGASRVWGAWIDAFTSDAMFPEGAPSGSASAQWAVHRLSGHGRSPTPEELQHLVDELHVPILHAAVLRGLRLAGQYDRIAEIGRSADTEWLLMRSCCEYLKGRPVTSDIIEQVGAVIAVSSFPASPFAGNILINARQWAGGPVAVPQAVPAPQPPVVTASDVMTALEEGRVDVQPPFVLHCENEPELTMLAERLDPADDHTTASMAVEPNISFVAGGVSVGGVQSQQRDNHSQLRTTLRPVVAASNRFGAVIRWHDRLLSDRHYLGSFIRQLGVQGDADRLYQELAEHGELIVPLLDDSVHVNPLLRLIDGRIVPFLLRYGNVGTDGLLESLCALAERVVDPVIDPVLALLFGRWRLRFEPMTKRMQHDGNTSLWRAFGSLSRHPRFRMIPDYDLRLIELLPVTLQWFNKKDIIRCLLDAPRSYARLECLLFKSAPFQHWQEDDVDRLDDAADALFRQVVEG